MRKLLLCFVAFMLVATGALAQTADIVGAYSITLPDDLKAVELTEENMADGPVMDMESDALHAVAYVYEPDPTYTQTLDEMYENYLADQQEGFYSNVAIEEIGGERMIVYDIDEGTVGAITIAADGKTYEFILICEQDSAREAAKAAVESIAPMK